MKYTQADIKTQIRAAQANPIKIAEFSSTIRNDKIMLTKFFEAVVCTDIDTVNDIYPYIRVRYEQGEIFKIVFYTLQQLKMIAEDLTNFTEDRTDEYFEIIRKKY